MQYHTHTHTWTCGQNSRVEWMFLSPRFLIHDYGCRNFRSFVDKDEVKSEIGKIFLKIDMYLNNNVVIVSFEN
jgi:hypothetical protein